jgi:predicted permease
MLAKWMTTLWLRVKRLLHRRQLDRDLGDELQFHLAMREQKLQEGGVSPKEARYAARREFGNATTAKETNWDLWTFAFLETLWQDIRYGLRQLRRSPGFATVAVLSVALGIGANTAIFSMIDMVLLRSLPVKNPGQLVLLDSGIRTGTYSGDPSVGRWTELSYDAYRYLVRHNQSFQGIAAFRSGRDHLEVRWPRTKASGQAERRDGQLVAANYFSVMGVPAALGRVFEPGDDFPNARPVAVISYPYWQRRFHGDASAIGRAVDLNGTPFTIVGVTPPEFFGERVGPPPDFWLPLMFQPQITHRESYLTHNDEYWLNFIARLKPGVTRRQALAVLDVQLRQFLVAQAGSKLSSDQRRAIARAYIQLDPGGNGISWMRQLYSEPLHVLLGIVALVLLVACANVANLLLSKAAGRQREIAMRLTVGASRGRLIRQVLTESMLLAIIGGAAALLLAYWGVHLLASMVDRTLVMRVATNPGVLAFTLAIAVVTGLIFGLVPALRVSRTEPIEAMRGASPSGGRHQSGLTRGLIVVQVATSLVLVAGAGLLLRTLVNLENQNLGFRDEHVLLVNTDPRLAGFKPGQLDGLYRQLLDRLNALPGVESATIAYYSPMSGSRSTTGVTIQGYTPHPNEDVSVNENQVAPNYFATLGIPVLLGRPIGPQDTPTSPKVVVVNQAFVERFMHGQNPIGKRVWVGQGYYPPPAHLPQEIVGVVADARYRDPSKAPEPFAYEPLSQDPGFFAGNIEIRTAGDPRGAAAEVRQAIQDLDSTLPIGSVHTLRMQVNDQLGQQRLVARLSVLFGLLALALAAVGLYGVVAYWVTRRTQEIGMRMALGAQKADVLWLVVRRGLTMALTGVGCGVAAALALSRLIASSLYGVKPTDPLTFTLGALLVIAIALIASYIPARRAAKVDPMVALRYE